MKHKKIIFSTVFLLLFAFGLSIGTYSPKINFDKGINLVPKASDGEITIITPENKTYTQPDSGYYPASYGFENDQDGKFPNGWYDSSIGPGEVKIIDEINNHNHVMDLNRKDGTGYAEVFYTFQSQQQGFIEFWIRTTNELNYSSIWLCKDPPTFSSVTLDLTYYQGSFCLTYYNGIRGIIMDIEKDKWYHLRIDFDSTVDKFDVWVDNILRVSNIDYYSTNDGMDKLIFRSWRSDHHFYIDAIGFSWDSQYNIGDNLNEGLLLSYDNTTNLDWQGMSLDGQINRTILGNTTIPMPSDGLHRIQVFGNDTMGTMYESDVRYFSVFTGPPEITINSPTYSQVVGSTAPGYDLSITDPYESIWYSFDGGLTNHTVSALTGTLNQVAWSALSDGIITIDFYANNSAGMIGTAQVQVIKDSSVVEPPPAIPGYNIYILIGTLSISSILLIKKKKF